MDRIWWRVRGHDRTSTTCFLSGDPRIRSQTPREWFMRMTPATLGRSLLAAFGWFVIAYVVYGITTWRSYDRAFEQTKEGEALDIVLGRFGSPTVIEGLHESA